ncbi:Inner membrane protein YtfF [compost metagenome]
MVISVTANLFYSRHDGRLSWRKLTPALVLIACGLALVNVAELRGNTAPIDVWRYTSGLGLALLAVACWTWFPLRNARWLRENPHQRPATWATAQGLVTLPLALVGYLLVCGQLALTQPTFALPFGPRPEVFIPLMIAIGMLCSWIGALCWNEASQRLPTVLVGPLIVFEILAGLAYTFMLRQAWPPLLTLGGISCLIIGVIYAMRIKPQPVVVALATKE